MASFQFVGIDQVMEAYENRGVDCWSLWQGKDMLIKGEGSEDLKNFLRMIEPSGSTAIYTIRIYEDVDEAKKIKSNSPDDGRISFKLFLGGGGSDGTIIGTHYGYPQRGGPMQEILKRMEAIEEKLEHGANEEEEEGFNIGKFISGVLSDPNQLEHYLRIISGNNQQSVRTIGNVTHMGQNGLRSEMPGAGAEPNLSQQTAEEKLQRLGNAIDILERNDNKLVEHLEKFALMSEKNPSQFKMVLTMLEAS